MMLATTIVRGRVTKPLSGFLRALHRDLVKSIEPEIETTLQVAVMSASGLTRKEICQRLEITDLQVRSALERLERVAKEWDG